HGISRLPLSEEGQSPPKKKFKDYPIGYLHVDFAEVHTEQGKQYLFVAIDRTSKVAFAELHPHAKRVVAAAFLRRVLDKLPYKVHKVLTDNGVQFTAQPHQLLPGGHSFDRICREYGVSGRKTPLTLPRTRPTSRWDYTTMRRHRKQWNEPWAAIATMPAPAPCLLNR
ncbi:DDE-type integrase/transposase/recombinase, partial [Hymenobacter algoricola]|uniref:DDE-type integrase/transposase/recombinase n=1 Tax=Hymenobacter algoricola TaxID=486267 RepID=UPI003CD07F1D